MMPEHHAVFGCLRQGRLFAEDLIDSVPADVQKALDNITTTKSFTAKRNVIRNGDLCGIYVLADGIAAASLFNRLNERPVRFRIEKGEIIGLPETITSSYSMIDVKTVTPCRFDLIEREGFLNLLSSEPELCFWIFEHLSHHLTETYRRITADLLRKRVTRITEYPFESRYSM